MQMANSEGKLQKEKKKRQKNEKKDLLSVPRQNTWSTTREAAECVSLKLETSESNRHL